MSLISDTVTVSIVNCVLNRFTNFIITFKQKYVFKSCVYFFLRSLARDSAPGRPRSLSDKFKFVRVVFVFSAVATTTTTTKALFA